MANLGNFNANEVPPAGDFTPIPEGKYEAMIVESETVQNSSGNGSHLKLTLVVTRGEHEGRNLWHRLNLDNPSEKAVQIARGQLSAICRAVNILTPKDSTELHSLPLMVNVKQESYEGGVSNRITSFSACEGMPTPSPAMPKQQIAPWKR